MVKILIKLSCLLIIVLGVSCETNRVDTPRQLLAKEMTRLQVFLDSVPDVNNPDRLTVKELWTKNAVDTIDRSLENGLIYFEMETGSGEVVSPGKEVGIRFKVQDIVLDKNNHPVLSEQADNYNRKEPNYYVVGVDETLPIGVRQAVSLMRKYGKSKVIVPSPLSIARSVDRISNYYTSVYDIEVTYLSN